MTLLNDSTLSSMKFGFFHAGVEVNDLEYSFGFIEEGTDMFFCHPKKSPGYTYHTSVDMGETELKPAEFDEMIISMMREWPGSSYRLIGRNCCNFACTFCAALGVGEPPAWINALAESLVPVTSASQAISDVSHTCSCRTTRVFCSPSVSSLIYFRAVLSKFPQATLEWATNYRPPPLSGVLDENFQCTSLRDENNRCWPTPTSSALTPSLDESRDGSSKSLSKGAQRRNKSYTWLSFFFCGDEYADMTDTHSLVGELPD